MEEGQWPPETHIHLLGETQGAKTQIQKPCSTFRCGPKSGVEEDPCTKVRVSSETSQRSNWPYTQPTSFITGTAMKLWVCWDTLKGSPRQGNVRISGRELSAWQQQDITMPSQTDMTSSPCATIYQLWACTIHPASPNLPFFPCNGIMWGWPLACNCWNNGPSSCF